MQTFVPTLRFKKLVAHAAAPTKGSAGAAGYDLAAAQDVRIESKCRMLVKTGISIAVPMGTYGRIAPRSGLALKNGIDVMAGVIDSDYRGDVGVVLVNLGSQPFEIKSGDRIAQLVLERIEHNATVEEVFEDELSNDATVRGASGFGSTGMRTAPPPVHVGDEDNGPQKAPSSGSPPASLQKAFG